MWRAAPSIMDRRILSHEHNFTSLREKIYLQSLELPIGVWRYTVAGGTEAWQGK